MNRINGLLWAAALAVTAFAVSSCAVRGSAESGAVATSAVAMSQSSAVRPDPAAPAAGPLVATSALLTTAAPGSTAALVTSDAGSVATPLPQCSTARLKTHVAGRITFARTETPRAPWFVGAPLSGGGFEAGVAAAVARLLGFRPDQLSWVTRPATSITTGTAAGFDAAVGEFIAPDRAGAVDYSTGYFPVTVSVVVRPGRTVGKGLAGLAALRMGAAGPEAVGSASAHVRPIAAQRRFDSASSALAALTSGAVDAVALATPSALEAGSKVQIVGQLPGGQGVPAQFGMVLPAGSALTGCISTAIDLLKINGTLATLRTKWLPPEADRPLR